MTPNELTRRGFVGRIIGAGVGATIHPAVVAGAASAAARRVAPAQENRLMLCVFSKHLQFLDYEQMAAVAAEIGFEGVDLTVRPDGHVSPEDAVRDLPRAVEAVRNAGLAMPTITTHITSAEQEHARAILETAAEQGISGYRMGWIPYDPALGVAATLEALKPQMADLAALNEELGIHGDYQNHAGTNVGAPVWDLSRLFEDLDPAWIGVQYDIRHATVEGANAWPLGLNLMAPHVRSLVVKDFRWAGAEGTARVENVPLGKGHVDFLSYWQQVKALGLSGPVSVHFEYAMPGEDEPLAAEALRARTIDVMRRDLTMLRKMLVQAGLG